MRIFRRSKENPRRVDQLDMFIYANKLERLRAPWKSRDARRITGAGKRIDKRRFAYVGIPDDAYN